MSFLKKLFGRGGDKTAAPLNIAGAETDYNGFIIRATPFMAEGQYQSCGVICKNIDGTMREHRFIRADRFPSPDIAVDMIHRKARQIIDEQGEHIF